MNVSLIDDLSLTSIKTLKTTPHDAPLGQKAHKILFWLYRQNGGCLSRWQVLSFTFMPLPLPKVAQG